MTATIRLAIIVGIFARRPRRLGGGRIPRRRSRSGAGRGCRRGALVAPAGVVVADAVARAQTGDHLERADHRGQRPGRRRCPLPGRRRGGGGAVAGQGPPADAVHRLDSHLHRQHRRRRRTAAAAAPEPGPVDRFAQRGQRRRAASQQRRLPAGLRHPDRHAALRRAARDLADRADPAMPNAGALQWRTSAGTATLAAAQRIAAALRCSRDPREGRHRHRHRRAGAPAGLRRR